MQEQECYIQEQECYIRQCLMATDCNSHRLCQFMLKIFEIPAYQHVGHSLTTYNHTLPATPHHLQNHRVQLTPPKFCVHSQTHVMKYMYMWLRQNW